MKKGILVLVLLVATLTNAQEIADNTIGLRLGNYYGASYQKKLDTSSRIELGVSWRGYSTYSDIKIDAYYQKVLNFESVDKMNWFYGAGGGVGIWKYDSKYYYSYYDYNDSGTYIVAGGTVGLEYKFDSPILISIDARPEFAFGDFYDGFHINGGVAIRYTFK